MRAAGILIALVLPSLAVLQDRPTFTAETNLQSVAVEVTDRQGRYIPGLTAADFTLLENGRPQKIAFFGAENQPISLTVLVDSSASMQSRNKLAGVREMLPPLLRGNQPDDEIALAQFTDRLYPLQRLTPEQRLRPPFPPVHSRAGTAFYDALSTTLCNLRGASNLRQAIVVITDGADQYSRLSLDQLIHNAQNSRPQIFTIGFFDTAEAETFHRSGKTVALVSSREIDNPLQAFARISRETGAEAFFPANRRDLQNVLDRILGILRAQYTLAYRTDRPDAFRRIEVRVRQKGAVVSTRRTLGSDSPGAAVFSATSCEVSAAEHPFPWESHLGKAPSGLTVYRDDFSDPRSGWPVHSGLRYVPGAYQISNVASSKPGGPGQEGQLAAYGPELADFRASVSIEPLGGAAGLVFRLNDEGYYLLLLQQNKTSLSYKLAAKFWSGKESQLVPWTLSPAVRRAGDSAIAAAVECSGDRISVRIDGMDAISVTDKTFEDGLAGMAFFGVGRALFRDFQVEEVR